MYETLEESALGLRGFIGEIGPFKYKGLDHHRILTI